MKTDSVWLCILGILFSIEFVHAAESRRAFEKVVCHDNRMEPWRICIGANFALAQGMLDRMNIAFATTRFRMNATNVGKLRQRMTSWANGQYNIPFMDRRDLARADNSICLEFNKSSWSDLSKATTCQFGFPGFFDFDQWLENVAVFALDRETFARTKAIFERHVYSICHSNIAPWYHGNMLSIPLPGKPQSSNSVAAGVAAANAEVQKLISQRPGRRDEILFTMTMKAYGCDRYLR